MKQILVIKNDKLPGLYGKEVVLYSLGGYPTIFASKQVTTLTLSLNLNIVSGKGTFDVSFKPSRQLARYGVTLLGAYLSDNKEEVIASFMALGNDNIEASGEMPLLIGTLFEPVTYRQIDNLVAGGTVNVVQSQESQAVVITPTPAKKRGRKKT